jgi:hypothetical protein
MKNLECAPPSEMPGTMNGDDSMSAVNSALGAFTKVDLNSARSCDCNARSSMTSM